MTNTGLVSAWYRTSKECAGGGMKTEHGDEGVELDRLDSEYERLRCTKFPSTLLCDGTIGDRSES